MSEASRASELESQDGSTMDAMQISLPTLDLPLEHSPVHGRTTPVSTSARCQSCMPGPHSRWSLDLACPKTLFPDAPRLFDAAMYDGYISCMLWFVVSPCSTLAKLKLSVPNPSVGVSACQNQSTAYGWSGSSTYHPSICTKSLYSAIH